MKRLAAVFAALLMIAAAFCSCENVGNESTGPEEESSRNIYDDIESMLPPAIEDESGGFSDTQTITVVTDAPQMFISDGDTPTAYRTHLSERNAYLSKRYGIELAVRQETADNALTAMQEAALSGLEYAEILAFGADDTVKMWLAGVLYDLNGLPGFDPLSSAYDSPNATALATNRTFYMLPDPSCYWFDDICVMFCNSNLLDSSLEDPLELAAKGEWTWDKFTEHCKAEYAVSKDRFGFGTYFDTDVYANLMWISSGKKIVENTYKNAVAITATAEDMSETARELKNHYDTYYRYPETKSAAVDQFESGGLVFITNRLSYFYTLRDGSEKGLNYCMLPMPKLYGSQENYSCPVSESARVYSVPATTETLDAKTAARINAFFAVACATGGPAAEKAFVSTVLANYLTSNNETLALQAIVDGATFDFSTVFGSRIWDISYATTQVISDYIGFGSDVAHSYRYAKPHFDSYVSKKFNDVNAE